MQYLQKLFIQLIMALLLLVTLAARADTAANPGPESDVQAIASVRISELDEPGVSIELALPGQWVRSPRVFKQFKLVADFRVVDPQAHELWAVYIASFAHGGKVSVNGVEVGEVQTSTPEKTVWHTRPYIFSVPASLLRPGANQLEVRWAARESLTLISRIFVGPNSVVRPRYEERLFWQNTMAEVALVHALVIAVILLGIFSLRPQQKSYFQMGVGAIGFAIIVFTYMLPPMPAFAYPYWRFTHMAGIALFTTCAWLFLLYEGLPQNRWYPKFCLFWAFLGPTVYIVHFWLTDLSFFKTFETVWGVMAGAIGLYPVAGVVRSMFRQWAWRKLIFSMATGLAIVLGIADILLQGTAKSVFGNVGYSMQIVSPLWFTALTAVLVTDFVASLSAQDHHREQMMVRLAEQEEQLSLLHRENQRRASEQAASEERQRIMQDMHDGLGSQLITSLVMSERGEISNEQVTFLLRECIDDLRLAIDTMSYSDGNFIVATGNLRFRMEPRLRAAGLRLKWDASRLNDAITIPAGKMLPLLRIMQESIANALKHSKAREIRVTLASDENHLSMQIQDDGTGFDASQTRMGKGISGMQRRARGIGADFAIASEDGTRVSIDMPLIDNPSGEEIQA